MPACAAIGRLLRELEAMGRSVSDIRALLLTHGDVDHVGFAERLRREHGVPVFVGAADAAEARGEGTQAGRRSGSHAPRTDGEVLGLRTHPRWHAEHADQGGHTDRRADDARRAGRTGCHPLPGHTPGSVAYHVPLVDAIFMGDAMTTRSVTTGIVGPALGPFTVDPPKAVTSLDALDGLSAKWVLPGHGDPGRAVAEAPG